MAIDEAQTGRETTDGPSGMAQEVATQAKEQVQQRAEEVRAKASDRVREQLDSRSTQLGEQMTSYGEALRRAAQHLESEGNSPGANAAHRAADQAERLSGYLTGSDSNRLLADLERMGRQRPWAAGAIGIVAGFIGARFLKASSESRYGSSYRARSDAEQPLTRDPTATVPMPPVRPDTLTPDGSR